MELPVNERAFYAKSPLAEVVCQVQFPRLLALSANLPVDFQKRVGIRYPLLEVREGITFAFGSPGNAPHPARSSAFDFYSEDRQSKVTLTPEFVALTTSQYTRWEDFRALLSEAISATFDIYEIKMFTRIGLRFQNLIQPGELGIGELAASDLIVPELLGPVSLFGPKLDTYESFTHLRPDESKEVVIRFALAEVEGSSETAYIIDCDTFTNSATKADSNAILQLLDALHSEASNIFRWCIKRPLHDALGPEPC